MSDVIIKDSRTEEQIQSDLDASDRAADEILKSPERVIEFLHSTGFYTSDGKIKEEFRECVEADD